MESRVLYVDDEASLLVTMSAILKLRGFTVRAVGTVSEALTEITTQKFDVLISDLNIGEPGDGFTVVSAMRRTQPKCITFILTGFPAFESALAAIQSQVDGYLVKPAHVPELVSMIEEKLRGSPRLRPPRLLRLCTLLRENAEAIGESALLKMKSDPALAAIAMSDEQRVGFVPALMEEIARQIESAYPGAATDASMNSGRQHGLDRAAMGYEVCMLVTDVAIVDETVHDFVRERLLMLDTSNLMMDLKHFDAGMHGYLKQSIRTFCEDVNKPAAV